MKIKEVWMRDSACPEVRPYLAKVW